MRFPRISWLLQTLDSKFLSMAEPLCVLLKNNNPDPILWEEKNNIEFGA